jgi:hypothetical protein
VHCPATRQRRRPSACPLSRKAQLKLGVLPRMESSSAS